MTTKTIDLNQSNPTQSELTLHNLLDQHVGRWVHVHDYRVSSIAKRYIGQLERGRTAYAYTVTNASGAFCLLTANASYKVIDDDEMLIEIHKK